MYVHEEDYKGRKLSEVINTDHVNHMYLPGVKLPTNVVAVPDVRKAIDGAHLLDLRAAAPVHARHRRRYGRTCAEGSERIVACEGPGLHRYGYRCVLRRRRRAQMYQYALRYAGGRLNLISQFVTAQLNIDCSCMSGANIAPEVAREEFAETTIGYADLQSAVIFQLLFDQPYFRVNCVPDVAGVEISGALKNVVALAAGFVDGLGFGSNTKAAIMRIGMNEMRLFAHMVRERMMEIVPFISIDHLLSCFLAISSIAESFRTRFFDSCGMADLITSCIGGRNLRCAVRTFVHMRRSPIARSYRRLCVSIC